MLFDRSRYCAPVSRGTGLTPVRTMARSHFRRLGTDRVGRAEILVLINELATNIIRHGGSGEICMFPLMIGKHSGFFIRATDTGPGIKDLEKAMEPGHSEDKGLGMGLSAISNLADDVRISSMINGGAQVEVWKWLT